MNKDLSKFKDLLDQEYTWPDYYTFKFIVPAVELPQAHVIFKDFNLKEKPSSKGKYVSLTFRHLIHDSDEIIHIYKIAKKVNKIISL